MHLPWRDVDVGGGPAVSTSVLAEEAEALAQLAAGRRVVEVGSANGYSAIVMAKAGAQVTSVDSQPDSMADVMRRNLAAHNVASHVEMVQEPSPEALRKMLPGRRKAYGMAFIDGWHGKEAVKADVAAAMPLLARGGVLAVHDYGEDCCCPDVKTVLDEMFPGGPSALTGTLFTVMLP